MQNIVKKHFNIIWAGVCGIIIIFFFKTPSFLLILIALGITIAVMVLMNSLNERFYTEAAMDAERIKEWICKADWQLLECKQTNDTGPFWRGRACVYYRVLIQIPQRGAHLGWIEMDHNLLASKRMKLKWVTPRNKK